MRNVIVSCAPPGVGGGANLGMQTVDFALHAIARERQVLDRVRLYRPWPAYLKDRSGEYPRGCGLDRWPMTFQYAMDRLGGDDEADHLLFWGDFQHGRDYVRRSAGRMLQVARRLGEDRSEEQCLRTCREYFLLAGRVSDSAGPQPAMFGGTLFQNRLTDYLDADYLARLTTLYRRAGFVRLRDPYSAAKVAELREDWSRSYLGVDPALLNRPGELLDLPHSGARELADFEGAVGVFLGRHARGFPLRAAWRFVRRIARRLGRAVAWVPWNRHAGGMLTSSRRAMRWLARPMVMPPASLEITSGDILAALRSVSVMVTDTYHVAIGAMVFGTPCVCLYEPSPAGERDANMGFRCAWRDKRALLYLCFDLTDFLVPTTDLTSRRWRRRRADNICDLVRNREVVERAYKGLRALADENRRAVGDYLVAAVG